MRWSLSACWLPATIAFAWLAFPRAAHPQGEPLRGYLHVVWDAEPVGGDREGRRFYLVQGRGRATPLVPDPLTREAADALTRLDGQLVELTGRAAPGGLLHVLPTGVRSIATPPRAPARGPSFPNDVATILCRFADDTVPRFPVSSAELIMGSAYPGMQQYYAELSREPTIMMNSRVRGWFTLPQSRSFYVNGGGTDFAALVDDCTSAADTSFFFPNYRAVNLQFNGPLSTRSTPPFDTLSFGGSWTLALDGAPPRQFGMTWLSSTHIANYVVYTHEMGHGFGWPHSSGDYGQEYDSNWDVMSRGYLRTEPPWGSLTIHTIAPHKWRAGWIDDARRWRPAFGRTERGVLARSALPPDSGWLSLEIPLGDAWTLWAEARRVAGHDRPLPAEAVVLHRYSGYRAYVVDVDLNGNPNDAGAAWVPGETYADFTGHVALSVDSLVADGFALTVRRGFMVRVTVAGMGRVTADTGGISGCRVTCFSEPFDSSGATVTLTATPDSGHIFGGWTGACFGSGACSLTMTGSPAVTAVFAAPVVIGALTRVVGVMGSPYADTLRASGDVARWRVTSGALPPGLVLDTVVGVLSGVPTQAGVFEFTVQGSSPWTSSTRTFTLVIGTPAIVAADVIDMLLGSRAALTDEQLRYLDLIGNRNGRFDIGDVRAWLRLTGTAARAPARVTGARR